MIHACPQIAVRLHDPLYLDLSEAGWIAGDREDGAIGHSAGERDGVGDEGAVQREGRGITDLLGEAGLDAAEHRRAGEHDQRANGALR